MAVRGGAGDGDGSSYGGGGGSSSSGYGASGSAPSQKPWAPANFLFTGSGHLYTGGGGVPHVPNAVSFSAGAYPYNGPKPISKNQISSKIQYDNKGLAEDMWQYMLNKSWPHSVIMTDGPDPPTPLGKDEFVDKIRKNEHNKGLYMNVIDGFLESYDAIKEKAYKFTVRLPHELKNELVFLKVIVDCLAYIEEKHDELWDPLIKNCKQKYKDIVFSDYKSVFPIANVLYNELIATVRGSEETRVALLKDEKLPASLHYRLTKHMGGRRTARRRNKKQRRSSKVQTLKR